MAVRLLLLTQWFDPEPTLKGLAFARELIRQGFEVEVVTGFPNYPGGKLYPGYRIRLIQREAVDGVFITRVPLYPSHDESFFKRIANYFSFSVTALCYCLFVAQRPDAVYVYHPPLSVAFVGGIVRMIRRIPVLLDVQDIWPDTLLSTGMLTNQRLLAIIDRLCHWIYAHVDRIVVLSPGFKNLLVARGVPEDKINIIFNWCDETALSNLASEVPKGFPGKDCFRILFAGTMGSAQALDAVIDAAEIVSNRSQSICFVFVGGGIEVDRLKKRTIKKKLSNVIFLPRVPMMEVGALLREADALLVHLRKDPLFMITIPSKTQAYMAVAKPILMAVGGDAANLVNSAQCGITADSENPESIASAAIQLSKITNKELVSMGSRAREFYFSRLSIESGIGHFRKLFYDLIK